MAFFGSKAIERDLRRSYSTDRLRRERTRTTSTPTSSAQPHNCQKAGSTMPAADEFGVVSSRTSSGKDDPPSLTFSTTTASASLTSHPLTPVTPPSLSVPVSINGSRSPSSSPASSIHKQPSSRTRTISGSGSKHSTNSHSSNPSRRRTPQLEVDERFSSDAVARVRRPSSGSSGSKKGDAVTRLHSSSELKVERSVSKSRSKNSIRAQAIKDSAVGAAESGLSDSIPSRPPRSTRPPDMHQTSSSKPLPPSSAKAVASLSQKHNNVSKHDDPHATRTVSSASPSTSPSNTGLPLRQTASSSSPSAPTTLSSTLRREDSSLSVLANNKKSSGGNASDSSYGTPFTEFGVGGFSVKRLLSKPAASSASAGVRSEPDMSTDSYDSYSAYALATRRRRVEGRANTTDAPSSIYSLTGESLSAGSRDHSRKPTTSDPEPPRHGMGSLGRSRGIEWGHVLGRERERERERGKVHVREGSSYSLSSPSEGAPGYPYGLAYERIQDRRASRNTRPVIQLTTSAVKRLSALGVRETDRSHERERSHSPGTPMTFGPAPSPTPSPLTSAAASNSRAGARTGGRASTQPSPTTSASIVRRAESPRPPVGLTPAEIVAHQYKEQERRRTELEREVTRQAEVPEMIHSSMHSMDISEFDYEMSQRTVRVREREKNREGNGPLVRRASTNALSSPISRVSKSSHKNDGNMIGEPPSTPYYTVFGEPTGRVVNIGSARDSAFGLFDRAQESRAKETEQAVVAELSGCAASGISVTTTTTTNGSSDGLGTLISVEKPARSHTLRRKLSRKMSGKLKGDGGSLTRGGGGTGGRESGSDGRDDKLDLGELLAGGSSLGGDDWFATGTEGILRARPSLTLNTTTTIPGRRSTTLPREKHAASVKMSLDSYVAVQSVESTSGGTLPSAVNGVPFGKRRPKDEKDKEKGKLWGLVKRISSNTLKDRYKRCSSDTVPPVPALPRDVSSSAHASPTLDDDKDKFRPNGESPREGVDARAIHLGTPPPCTPLRRPSTAPALNIGEATKEGRFATLRKKPSIAQVHPSSSPLGMSPATQVSRPSATTRSSSPMSSDLVFSYKQSDVSSMTSYGDLRSTTSKLSRGHPVLGEHILPPETLSMFDELNLNFEPRRENDSKSKPDSRAVVPESSDSLFYGEEAACHQALPVPPRRSPSAPLVRPDADDDSRAESPTIPSFSADYAINTFGARRRAASTLTSGEFVTNNKVSPPASSGSPASSLKGDPPPRPPRSALRAPPASSNTNANANILTLHSQPAPSPSLVRVVFDEKTGRTSIGGHSQASTARPGVLRSSSSPCSTPSPPPPPELLDSSHQSPVSASDSASSTMTFRDLNYTTTSSSGGAGIGHSGGKATLTEKEKMDKWNDLLDRSERAGGTLHVGVGGTLLSDQLRESSYEPTIRDSLYDY